MNTMIPIRRHHRVLLIQRRFHAHAHRLLTVVQVTKPANKLPLIKHIRRDLQSTHHVRLREHIDNLALRRLHHLRRRFDEMSLERHRRLDDHLLIVRIRRERPRPTRVRRRLFACDPSVIRFAVVRARERASPRRARDRSFRNRSHASSDRRLARRRFASRAPSGRTLTRRRVSRSRRACPAERARVARACARRTTRRATVFD